MKQLLETLDLALEALEESVDLVREDYENAKKLYSNYPSRQARLIGLEDGLSKHEAAITAIKQARSAPVQEPVAQKPSNTRYTVEVEGRARTYWDNIHDAITNAQRAVYASVDATTRAIDDLKAGRIAEWCYGFSAVRIYPPDRAIARATPPAAQRQWVGLEKDAARWRFLVDNSFDKEGVTQFHVWEHSWEPHSQTGEPTEWKQRLRGPALDRFVDSAIEAKLKEKNT